MQMYNENNIKDDDFYKTFSKIYTDITLNGKAPWLHETDKPIERGLAFNPKSGVVFKGVNSLILEMKSAQKGYSDSRWLSQSEIYELGWEPKSGEFPTPIAYVNKYAPQVDVNPVNGKAFGTNNPRQRYYYMYNAEQLRNHELVNDKEIGFSKKHIKEKIQNVIDNVGNKDIRVIQSKLSENAIKAVPENMKNLASGIVQYRLAQELKIPYKPQIAKESLEKYATTKITQEDLLRTGYQVEVAKDRLVSRNNELEHDRTRTVQRGAKREQELDNEVGRE